MANTSNPTRAQTVSPIVWIGGGIASFMLLASVLIVGNFLLNGSSIRAEAEARLARAVDNENKAFCSKFGIGPQTARFDECVAALKEIRNHEIWRHTDPFI